LSKSALVTGITGQDGSYLSELLLSKGYTVHGVVRRSSSFNTGRMNYIYSDPHEMGRRLLLHYGDLTHSAGLRRVIEDSQPDEVSAVPCQSVFRASGIHGGCRCHGCFDWVFLPVQNVTFDQIPVFSWLRISFDGKEPEASQLLQQFVVLEPNRRYRLKWTAESDHIAKDSGFQWRLLPVSDQGLAETTDLVSPDPLGLTDTGV
jgi:hypothetical protein